MNFKEKIDDNKTNMFNVRDDLQHLTVEEIRKFQPKNNFSVCVFNVLGDLNVGTILRSSVIFGADKFYLAGRKKLDRRSMVGAQNYIDMVRLDNYNLSDDTIDVASTFDTIRKDGYKIVCCETQQKRIDSGIMDYMRERKENPCFVMGSEGCGLPQEALNNADWLVSIPQFGVMRSYNVATAASIIMYEWMRGK